MPDLADDQVSIPNGPTPRTHTVSHIDGVIPKAVTATFDGTGAAKFLPVLIIAGKEGREVARIPAPEVAAGATAEVSWFPRGLKPAAATVAGASLPVAFLDGPDLTLNTWVVNTYTPVLWNLFDTNDPTAFAFPGSGGPTTVRHLTGGVFRVVFGYFVTGFTFHSAPGVILSKITTNVNGSTLKELAVNHTTAAMYEGNPNVGTKFAPDTERVFNYGFPDDIRVDMAWTGAGSVTIQPVMFVYRLGNKVV